MGIARLEWAKRLQAEGRKLGRAGMSERALAAVAECDGSYKGVMKLAGRLKAIAQMAKADDYWDEQVNTGFMQELRR